MPLATGVEPAAGDATDYNRDPEDGRYRSHRFLAANQVVPALLQIPGWEQQVELTEQWLRGDYEIPEIADKWRAGPAVPIELTMPETAIPGEQIQVGVLITSNKVGHDFPTGPLDIIQAWIDIEVTGVDGQQIFRSGSVDDEHFIEPGSFMFKAEPVDSEGNLIDRHNLWEMVGVRYRRSLFPGHSDHTEFNFACPSGSPVVPADEGPPGDEQTFQIPDGYNGDRLIVRARLRYRKFDQFLLNFLFGEESGLSATITDMSTAEGEIRIQRSDEVVASRVTNRTHAAR